MIGFELYLSVFPSTTPLVLYWQLLMREVSKTLNLHIPICTSDWREAVREPGVFHHNWQYCHNLISQFAIVQTILLASRCHDLSHTPKNGFIWPKYCPKKQMDSGLAWSGQQYSSPQWSKFVALQVHKITTTVMTNIIVH